MRKNNYKNGKADENNGQNGEEIPNGKNLIISFISAILSAVFFGLTFSPLKIYALLCAVLCALISLAFLEKQKKKGKVKYYKAVNIFAYAMLAITLLTFIGGIIYSAAL